MEEILSDIEIYQRIQKDPINKLNQDLRAFLTKWKEFIEEFIEDSTYRGLLTTDGNIPSADGLIKIHKADNH